MKTYSFSNPQAMDRDECISQYLGLLTEDERYEILWDLIQESDKNCYTHEW